METSDLECLRSFALRGDNAAFGTLMRLHASWMTSAARRRLEDEHLAEDAVQAVFMLLASKAATLVDSDRVSLAAWLFHAMHLTCCRMRQTRARRECIEAEVNPASAGRLPDDELRALLEDAIAQLPPRDRQAIVRRYYQGEDFETIGKEFECSADAVRKRIARSLVHVQRWMLQDGFDVVPDSLLAGITTSTGSQVPLNRSTENDRRIEKIAKGTATMMQQSETTDFTIWSAEFFVKEVEANLDFFEKLGFRRHFIDMPDAMGRVPRASLRGGKTARIWLRRACEAEGTRPTPGATLFFWIEGGADALSAHRDTIAAQGLQPSAFFDDISLRNFTVTSPDGYAIGFFTTYK